MQRSAFRHSVLVCLTVAGLTVVSSAKAECTFSNTCFGNGALESNTTGIGNTGIGHLALRSNTTGEYNSAVGFHALISNTSGVFNTAVGTQSLSTNTSGSLNTANGFQALEMNSTSTANSAFGAAALHFNVTGNNNTASGVAALAENITGNNNSATGFWALLNNQTGNYNTASGASALERNFSGSSNTATGVNALYSNNDGFYNTANGVGALKNSASGYRNVALGYQAGFAITTGSDNIMVGGGTKGKAADNGVIRIGNSNYQTKAFVAGIRGVKTGLSAATPVFIDANGQLGTIKSSREAKEDIKPMGAASERLLSLQPVTFRYIDRYDDGRKPIEFGLIAEEVAEAFPELVVSNAEGDPETVRYDLIATLLLNEFQKQHRVIVAQAAELAQLKKEFAAMAAALERLGQAQMVATTY
jgi:hypothetical protein